LLLLLTAPLAGCLESNGTLIIGLSVSDSDAIEDFRSINLTLQDLRLRARTLDPQRFPSNVSRIELVETAAAGDVYEIFHQQVRADQYTQISVTVPTGAQHIGHFRNGTSVAVVVPGGALTLTTSFQVPRGGQTIYILAIKVERVDTGSGAATYTVIADEAASRPFG
jgi:hypothetical protein